MESCGTPEYKDSFSGKKVSKPRFQPVNANPNTTYMDETSQGHTINTKLTQLIFATFQKIISLKDGQTE